MAETSDSCRKRMKKGVEANANAPHWTDRAWQRWQGFYEWFEVVVILAGAVLFAHIIIKVISK